MTVVVADAIGLVSLYYKGQRTNYQAHRVAAQNTRHEARWRSHLPPFQMYEELGAKGLPSVIGITRIEDAGLDDASSSTVA